MHTTTLRGDDNFLIRVYHKKVAYFTQSDSLSFTKEVCK